MSLKVSFPIGAKATQVTIKLSLRVLHVYFHMRQQAHFSGDTFPTNVAHMRRGPGVGISVMLHRLFGSKRFPTVIAHMNFLPFFSLFQMTSHVSLQVPLVMAPEVTNVALKLFLLVLE